MNRNLRIFKNTSDFTADVTDFLTSAKVVELQTSDALYIGSPVPLNNLYFDVSVANSNAATLSVSVWYNREWTPVVDLIDETSGFSQAGRISWELNRQKAWFSEAESEDVTGLTGTSVYDLYWVKITTSANFSADTALNYVGQMFCTEADLESVYSDLRNANLKASTIATNNSWKRKIMVASEMIVDDLISKRIIWAPGQLLDWSRFKYPCVHKAAEIIYGSGMGAAYAEEQAAAAKAYSRAISMGSFVVDLNGDGRRSNEERRSSIQFMTR